jgi:hypothetical protein
MKYTCKWKLKLPLKFVVSEDVEPKFAIKDDLSLELDFFNQRYFENIIMSKSFEMKNPIDFSGISKEKIVLINQLTCSVGPDINRFYVVLCQKTNNYYQNIFNGEDFVVPYTVMINDENGKLLGGWDSYNITPVVSKNTIDSVLREVSLNAEVDLPNLLMRDAKNFVSIGLLDMAILCAHITLEVCVKKKFNKDIFNSEMNYRIFSEIKGPQIFMEKHLVIGPYLVYGKSLKEENAQLFEDMILLDKLRNKVAHEGTAMTHSVFQDYSNEEIYTVIEFLIDDVEEVVLWVDSLEGDNLT